MANIITLNPGEALTVVATSPGPVGPVDPGYSPPWAQVPPGQGPGPQPPLGFWGPNDPRPTNPIAGWNPGTGTWPDVPPPTEPPTDGYYVWAWSDQLQRWVWVKVPGEDEAGPKT